MIDFFLRWDYYKIGPKKQKRFNGHFFDQLVRYGRNALEMADIQNHSELMEEKDEVFCQIFRLENPDARTKRRLTMQMIPWFYTLVADGLG